MCRPFLEPERVVGWSRSGEGSARPGRTSVAVHLALDHRRTGGDPVLIDGDGWAPAIAQLLGLPTEPALTAAVRDAANGWPTPLADEHAPGP